MAQPLVAVITGAASGIGRAAAELFAARGACVLAVDLNASGVRFESPRIVAHDADITDSAAVALFIEAAVARWGRIDALFANAGIIGASGSVLDMEPSDLEKVFGVNVYGTFECMRAAAAQMLRQDPLPSGRRGAIVVTASVAGLRSGAGPLPYSASKAATISMVQVLANELAGTGVRVNALCPGLVETGMTRPLFELARARGTEGKIGQLNPLKRPGQAHEIAEVAHFLASDASAYINGQALAVDGGLSSSLPVVPRVPSKL